MFRVAIRARDARATVPRERALECRVAEVLGRHRRRVARARADGDGARRNAARIFLHSASYSEKHTCPSRSRSTSSKSVATRSEASSRSKRAGDAPRSAVTTSSGERRPSPSRSADANDDSLGFDAERSNADPADGAVGTVPSTGRAAAAAAAHGDADAVADASGVALAVHASFAEHLFAERKPRGNSADFAVFRRHGTTARRGRGERAVGGDHRGAVCGVRGGGGGDRLERFARLGGEESDGADETFEGRVARPRLGGTGRRRRRRRRMSDGERARRGRRRTDGRTARGTCGWRSSADDGRRSRCTRARRDP